MYQQIAKIQTLYNINVTCNNLTNNNILCLCT